MALRIWLAPSLFYPHHGGVEEVSASLAHHLRLQGHDVAVITNRYPPELTAEATVDGVPVHRFAFPSPTRSVGGIVSFIRERRNVARALERLERPELIHIHCVSSQTPPVIAYALRHRIPVVLSTHGETEMDASHLYHRSRWARWALRRAARRASILTACSQWTVERTALVAPAFSRAEVVYNGIDGPYWHAGSPPETPVIAAWGRHVPQKGFDTLLKAFAQVRAAQPAAQLLLGGDGPERPALERLAGDGVTFLGRLDRPAVKRLLGHARVVAVPSRVEPFGMVALEALAAGRVLVYSDVGGLTEATGGAGVAVPAEDIEAWAAALSDALTGRSDVDAGLRRAAQLEWSNVIQEWETIYKRATRVSVGSRKGPSPVSEA
jgi:glycogen synthase